MATFFLFFIVVILFEDDLFVKALTFIAPSHTRILPHSFRPSLLPLRMEYNTRFLSDNQNASDNNRSHNDQLLGVENANVAQSLTRTAAQISEADFKPEWFTNAKDRKSFLENMQKYDIELEEDNDLLSALCDPEKIEALEHNVTAITVKTNIPAPFQYRIAPLTLYQRYWYEDLLISINERRGQSVALIGSAGTSKSTWQFWYLYRVLQSIHHGKPWPPLMAIGIENPDPPELIIREMNTVRGSQYFYFLMREKRVYRSGATVAWNMLNYFSPSKVVLLYEPGSDSCPISTFIKIPCIATLSPNPIRYHEFCKVIAQTRYQMLYTLSELLTIADHMKQTILDPKLRELYSPEQVNERFKKFGGIIRRVLPVLEDSKEDDKNLNDVVRTIAKEGLHAIDHIIDADSLNKIGSYVVQWSPAVVFDENDSDKYIITDFATLKKQLTSEFVVEMIKDKIFDLLLEELQQKLSFLVRSDLQNPILPNVFEEYAVKYCVNHFDELKRFLAIPKLAKLTLIRGTSKYQNMENGILYYPLNKKFPACEAYFKSDKDIYLIQVSKIAENKVCVNSALAKCFFELDLPPENICNVKLLYFRLNAQSIWKIKLRDFKATDTTNEQIVRDQEMIEKYNLNADEKGMKNVEIIENNVRYFDLNIPQMVFEGKEQLIDVADSGKKEATIVKTKKAKKMPKEKENLSKSKESQSN